MANIKPGRPLAHSAVEAGIRTLATTNLKPKSDAMLRTFLAFRAAHQGGMAGSIDMSTIKRVVEDLFTILPTPPDVQEGKYSGTIGLRGSNGLPIWFRNDSYRGSFVDYVGPNSPGRFMFEGENWREPMLGDAVERVAETLDRPGYGWPPRDALAAVALRNDILDPDLSWSDLSERACAKFGLLSQEWMAVTSPPAIDVSPFEGDPWNFGNLSRNLRPPGAERAEVSERRIEELPPNLALQVERVFDALAKYGRSAIVALAGVPGTSKSHVARLAARTFASEGCLREIQLSPSYTYEEFMEGPRYGKDMEVQVFPGAFLELNERALKDPGRQYVLLVEELTRADLPRVLGELLTYIEYRDEDDLFSTMYRRDIVTRLAPNLAVLATYNPTDRSAINLDAAIIRRMRILDFPPSTELLSEILSDNGVEQLVVDGLVAMFNACRELAGDRFDEIMPFGHAIFASIENETDLHELWHETIKRILVRPHAPRHELYDVVVDHYPWHAAARVRLDHHATDNASIPKKRIDQ
jgi:hypothetical protein